MELMVGRQYKRSNKSDKRDAKTIHGVFGGGPQRGISYAQDGNIILIFTDPVGSQKGKDYADHWDQGVFHYTGEGRAGDQQMRAGNDEIRRHRENGKRLYVFGGVGGEVPYWGEFAVETNRPFYSDTGIDSDGRLRQIIVFRLVPVGIHMRLGIVQDNYDPHTFSGGVDYKPAKEKVWPKGKIEIGASAESGEKRHSLTQNAFAKFLSRNSIQPQSPSGNDPQVDILWERNGEVCIGEIKSLTKTNQSRMLRLAIGQILDYRYQFFEMDVKVNCHIIVECKPDSARWDSICQLNGIKRLLPDTFTLALE